MVNLPPFSRRREISAAIVAQKVSRAAEDSRIFGGSKIGLAALAVGPPAHTVVRKALVKITSCGAELCPKSGLFARIYERNFHAFLKRQCRTLNYQCESKQN